MTRRSLSFLVLPWLAAASALLPCPPLGAQAAAAETGAARPAATRGVEVTFLANEGFFLQSGDDGVLIDSFLRDPVSSYSALSDEIYMQLVNAQAPFDKRTLVLVSHRHGDHVQMRGLEKYLTRNAQALLMTSPQVIEVLKKEAQDFPSIQERVSAVATTPGVREKREREGVSVTFVQLRHAHKDSDDVVNVGHLITMGGLKILHVGDAEASPAPFAPYYLAAEHVDIAIVPYWFFGSAEGGKVLRDEISARYVIASHIPPKLRAQIEQVLKESFPDAILFADSLEKRTFLPKEADQAPGQGR